jgi:hypothetical protein
MLILKIYLSYKIPPAPIKNLLKEKNGYVS